MISLNLSRFQVGPPECKKKRYQTIICICAIQTLYYDCYIFFLHKAAVLFTDEKGFRVFCCHFMSNKSRIPKR